jgi:hypothetical protein
MLAGRRGGALAVLGADADARRDVGTDPLATTNAAITSSRSPATSGRAYVAGGVSPARRREPRKPDSTEPGFGVP